MAKSRKLTGGAGWTLLPSDDTPSAAPAGETPAKKGRPRVTTEKRAGGRTVTRLSPLEGMGPEEIAAWLKQLKAALGAGGTCGTDWLELQGDCREALAEAARRHGFKV